jgi:cell division septal protein FtsQ
LAKKKKFGFRIRYILILLLIYFLFKIFSVYLPVGNAHISYARGISDIRKNEVGEIVKRVELDDLKELKRSIESLVWVESVSMKRNILGKLRIQVNPRVPVVRIAGTGTKVMDRKGFIFNTDKVDSLPEVEVRQGVPGEEVLQAIKIFRIMDSYTIDKMQIKSGEVRTKCSNFEVIWGNGDFEKKYEILKRILRDDKENQFKGRLDFRFKNMVILRR